MEKDNFTEVFMSFLFLICLFFNPIRSQTVSENQALDRKVKNFLDSHAGHWYDMNIPTVDGKLLYELIIKNDYTKALDIGTSTGHSAIWMAWALSKTGGKLITIEIDEDRHKEALENFKEAGLSGYIDARLADAHKLVKELDGPFDFIFSDADKGWYKNYFVDLESKLEVGGCFTAHNVHARRRGRGGGGTQEFLDYIYSLPNFKTTINSDGAGVSISYKRENK